MREKLLWAAVVLLSITLAIRAQAPKPMPCEPSPRFQLFPASDSGKAFTYRLDVVTGQTWVHLFPTRTEGDRNEWVPIPEPPKKDGTDASATK